MFHIRKEKTGPSESKGPSKKSKHANLHSRGRKHYDREGPGGPLKKKAERKTDFNSRHVEKKGQKKRKGDPAHGGNAEKKG